MPKKATDPYEGATLIEPSAPRAELVERPDISTIAPDIRTQDPSVFAGLTTDHFIRTLHAQGIPVDAGQIFGTFDKVQQDAIEYRRTIAEKEAEVAPGGTEQKKLALATAAEAQRKQIEQGPSATALAAQQGNIPGIPGAKTPGLIKAPSEQQNKDWAAYTEGFHNLQDLHTLFDSMATKTAGAGGPAQSLAGLTAKIVNLTSPEARVYHSYVDSSLIPLAKSIMGDAATTAGKETVQHSMTEALPNEADTVQTGGEKMYMFYKRALDKMQTERDLARHNGIDTGGIDTMLNDFQSFLKKPDVAKYNPIHSQPLVQSGVTPQTQAAQSQVQQTALAGTNPPSGYFPGQGMQMSGTGTGSAPLPGGYFPGQGMQMSGTGEPLPAEPSAAVQAVVNAPGQVKQFLTTRPAAPAPTEEEQVTPSLGVFGYGGQ